MSENLNNEALAKAAGFEVTPYNPPGLDDFIRAGAASNSRLSAKLEGDKAKAQGFDCEICRNWVRTIDSSTKFKSADGLPLIPNHHPNCPHYNDSLMDVYKVTVDGVSAYMEHLQDAKDTAGDDECSASIECIKMPREIFENLPEFNGF